MAVPEEKPDWGDLHLYNPRTGLPVRSQAELLDARDGPCHVGATRLTWEQFETRVSTVHLLLEPGFGVGEPGPYETMIFGDTDQIPPPYEGFTWGDAQWCYSSEDDAEAGHAELVKVITELIARLGHTVTADVEPFAPLIRPES